MLVPQSEWTNPNDKKARNVASLYLRALGSLAFLVTAACTRARSNRSGFLLLGSKRQRHLRVEALTVGIQIDYAVITLHGFQNRGNAKTEAAAFGGKVFSPFGF